MDPITFLVTPLVWLFNQSPATILTALVVCVGGVAYAFMVRE